jgi:site-specific DNA recombinase
VRAIFDLYLQHQALRPLVQELERRGWVNKSWVTRKGCARGGKRFTKPRLYELLTNVLYVGKVKHKHEVYDGEHPAIVDAAVWERVQGLLQSNGPGCDLAVRGRSGALLKGLLHCVACGCSMTPAHATKNRSKRYCYYTCSNAQRIGWHTCPFPSLPAADIERLVIAQLETVTEGRGTTDKPLPALSPQEQARVVEALVERVDYDGARDKLTLRLRPAGMQDLQHHLAKVTQEDNA